MQYYANYTPPLAMLAVDWKEHLVEYPCIIQYKLDGVRAFLSPAGEVYLGRSGHERIPLRGKFGKPKHWLDGELYITGQKLQYIAGLVNRLKMDDEVAQLEFHPFDVVGPAPQRLRIEMLQEISNTLKLAPVVTYFAAEWQDSAIIYRDLPPDAEGLMYRMLDAPYTEGRTNALLKRKRMQTMEVECIGYEEGCGKFTGTLGSFICIVDTMPFNVSAGELTNKERDEMWAEPPIGKLLTIRFPSKSAKGIPLQAQFVAVRDYEHT